MATVQENLFSDRVMSPAEAAYVAGIVDGEGTITLSLHGRASRRRSHYVLPRVIVVNSSTGMIDALIRMTGNGMVESCPARIGGVVESRKPVQRWVLSPNQIRHILPQIEPYLFA